MLPFSSIEPSIGWRLGLLGSVQFTIGLPGFGCWVRSVLLSKISFNCLEGIEKISFE